MIAVIDYGAGNLFSVCNALNYLHIAHTVTKDKRIIDEAQGVILPGVGAFPEAMERLAKADLIAPLKKAAAEKPFLGICLGMQMLFDYGYEFAKTSGLGLIKGDVRPIKADGLKVPHMGWNSITINHECPLTVGLKDGDFVYYVHSYAAITDDDHIAITSQYGGAVTGLVFKDNIFGAQFHPEKSGAVGLQLLKNFGGLIR